MKTEKRFRMIIAVMLLVIAGLSFFLLGSRMTKPEAYASQNTALEDKEKEVLRLAGSTAAISAAITLLPDDLATPLAEKVADVGGYMLLVLCAVYAERYLLIITGFAAWKLLFPIACVLLAVHCVKPHPAWKQIAVKLVVLGVAMILVIPVSIRTGQAIEMTYKDSISETIESAERAQENFTDMKELKDDVLNVVNRFMRAAAMYIVITCVFPILVLLFFLKLLNAVLGTDLMLKPIPLRGLRHEGA